MKENEPSLRSEILDLMEKEGISVLNPVQERAASAILGGSNVLIVAPTGSGKTEAALLPILSQFLEDRGPGISILYVTPLRALNRDMVKRIGRIGSGLDMSVEVRHGDTSPRDRRRQAKSPPDLLITTPETLQALLAAPLMRRHLSSVRWVVIDEVHAVLGSKRGVQLSLGLERLRLLAREGQVIGLSATVSDPEKAARLICGDRPCQIISADLPKRYEFTIEYPTPRPRDLDLCMDLFTSPEAAARVRRIAELVRQNRSVLVFTNARTEAELLGHRLSGLIEVAVHHGSVSREQRKDVEDRFKNGDLRAIVCTSTMELGIDVGFVDFVVQYRSPMTVSSLVQRFGRSGHSLDRTSKGSIICTSGEQVLESIAIARLYLEGRLEETPIHENALDVLAHQLVGLVIEGSVQTLGEAYQLIRKAYPYRNLPYEELEEVASFLEELGLLRISGSSILPTSSSRKYYFQNLSMIPDERRYPIFDASTGGVVGSLGEEFVSLRCRVGMEFICRGRVWRIVEMRKDGVIAVVPSENPIGAIPGWDGELPPVPAIVARRAAQLRQRIDLLDGQIGIEDPALEAVEDETASQREAGPMPGPELMVFEVFDRFLIIHSTHGTRVNRTLSLVLEKVFEEVETLRSSGFPPLSYVDAYRILFEFPQTLERDTVEDIAFRFRSVSDVRSAVRSQLLRRFPFTVKHVAARFGAIPRGLHLLDARARNLDARLRGTPVMKEAIREAETERLDLEATQDLLESLRKGDVALTIDYRSEGQGPTPLADIILSRFSEVPELASEELEGESQRVLERLLARSLEIRCLECGHGRRVAIRDVEDPPRCQACGSRLLTVPSTVEERVVLREKVSTGKTVNRDVLSRLKWKADLITVYGRRGLMALSVRGIGPQTAFRILSRMHEKEEDLVADLLRASARYEATRQYW